MSQISKVVGHRIRNYRLQMGLSQEELAEKAGCHPTYVSQIERGEKNATIESIEKLSTALCIPMSKLFEFLGGSREDDRDYPFLCHELVSSLKREEQKELYEIIQMIQRYKNR